VGDAIVRPQVPLRPRVARVSRPANVAACNADALARLSADGAASDVGALGQRAELQRRCRRGLARPTRSPGGAHRRLRHETRLSSQQATYEHGPRQRNRELYTSPEHAAPWDVFLEDLDAFFRWYNEEHEHSALGGRHPADVYADDVGAGREVEPSELAFMLELQRAHLSREGVRLHRRKYFAPELAPHVKKHVEVAVWENDLRSIEVFLRGQWLATAVQQELVTEAEEERFNRVQSQRNTRMTKTMKKVNTERVAAQDARAKKARCFVAPADDEFGEPEKAVDAALERGEALPEAGIELPGDLFDVDALNGEAAA
jgi:hypothetical protein